MPLLRSSFWSWRTKRATGEPSSFKPGLSIRRRSIDRTSGGVLSNPFMLVNRQVDLQDRIQVAIGEDHRGSGEGRLQHGGGIAGGEHLAGRPVQCSEAVQVHPFIV